MKYPILMADVINSSRKDSNLLMRQFKALVKTINSKHKADFISPLTITLGDEFQGIINTLENGIKTIFEIEETIIEKQLDLKLRYILYNGEVDTKINNKIAYEMLGEGLTTARDLLNQLKTENTRFLIKTNKGDFKQDEFLNKCFLLYQNFIDSWKTKDTEVVYNFLKYDDYKIVANKINVDKSSAWRRKKSLNIEEYKNIKQIIIYILNTPL